MIAIRTARLPQDKPALLGFIAALQHYEAAFEENRRLDARFAEDHFAAVLEDAAKGALFLAEDASGPLGWALVHTAVSPVYVREGERRHANLAELFVAEAARGQGVGGALIAACEDWARSQGLASIQIGHLARNARAAAAYAKAGYAPYTVQQRKRL
jgi:GNAT superfamily N-acetyltransferase